MKKLSISASLVVVSAWLNGCASAPKILSPQGKMVRLMQSDPAMNCEELGTVWGEKQTWETDDDAKTRVRNKAAELGANYVRMELINGNQYSGGAAYYKLSGTAFKCPDMPAPTAKSK